VHDLVIRNGTLVDGTGRDALAASGPDDTQPSAPTGPRQRYACQAGQWNRSIQARRGYLHPELGGHPQTGGAVASELTIGSGVRLEPAKGRSGRRLQQRVPCASYEGH
jgi:hypothetical protein